MLTQRLRSDGGSRGRKEKEGCNNIRDFGNVERKITVMFVSAYGSTELNAFTILTEGLNPGYFALSFSSLSRAKVLTIIHKKRLKEEYIGQRRRMKIQK